MSAKAVQKFFADNKADFPAGPYWAKDPEMVRNLKIAPVDSTYILLPYLNQAIGVMRNDRCNCDSV